MNKASSINEEPLYCSYTTRIVEEFSRRAWRRRGAAFIYVLCMVLYLFWRLSTLNPNHLSLSLLYYFAELIGLILGLIIIFNSWRLTKHPLVSCPQNLSVDVWIPTYKEDLDIIRKTLIAAKNISYPHGTWVLDDGKRAEIKALAEQLGINYVSREVNTNAKAGNLNNALEESQVDFIAVFDADHIPQPDALEKLLGYFQDDLVAMVQTPQDFYNTDAFQYMNPASKPGYWHDQSFFYNICLASHNGHNAASCVGSGVIYRKSALKDIGGIPEETLTEDTHTSLKLHKIGYKVVYFNDSVAYGLGSADLDEYYITRQRWANGNIATLKHEKIFTCSGLDWRQRLSYLFLGLIYLEGWQQLILFSIPIFSLIMGIPPFQISLFNVLVILFFPIITYLLLQEIGGGFNRFWTSEMYSMIRWPLHISASLAVIGKKTKWISSKKKIKGEVNVWLMLPQLSIFVLGFFALLISLFRLAKDFKLGPVSQGFYDVFIGNKLMSDIDFHQVMLDGYSVELVVVAGGWVIFNMIKVSAFAWKVVRSALDSDEEQYFKIDIPLCFDDGKQLPVLKISEHSAIIFQDNETESLCGKNKNVNLLLPDGLVEISCDFKRTNKKKLKAEFVWKNSQQAQRLINALYSPAWYQDPILESTQFLTPIDVIINVINYLIGKRARKLAWNCACLLKTAEGPDLSLCMIGINKNRAYSLLCFQTMATNSNETIFIRGKDSQLRHYRVLSEEPITSLPGKGLYGRQYYRYSIAEVEVDNNMLKVCCS